MSVNLQVRNKDTGCWTVQTTEGIARMANLHLQSPYFTGDVEALCIEKSLFEVINGNINGVEAMPEKNDLTPVESVLDEFCPEGTSSKGLVNCDDNFEEGNAVITKRERMPSHFEVKYTREFRREQRRIE